MQCCSFTPESAGWWQIAYYAPGLHVPSVLEYELTGNRLLQISKLASDFRRHLPGSLNQVATKNWLSGQNRIDLH